MTEFEPGQFVVHPDQPDWGAGQVQSVLGQKITVMFENAGKVVINTVNAPLEILPRAATRPLTRPPGTAR
jgi:hypothetical protein